MIGSLTAIVAYRRPARAKQRSLPAYVAPEQRSAPTLVLGESHLETTQRTRTAARVADDSSARALHGRHGDRRRWNWKNISVHVPVHRPTPPLEGQRSRAQDWRPGPRSQGRLLPAGERDADSCRACLGLHRDRPRWRRLLQPAPQRPDPYAVAYAVSTLVNNLFGKSKEPFWQQAYTDLLKFVILLRRMADGYTTLAEVYRYVLEDGKIEAEITKLKAALSQPPEVVVVPLANYELQDLATAGWRDWFQEGPEHMARQYTADLESHLQEHSDSLRGAQNEGDRVARSEASDRSGGPMVHVRLETTRQSSAILDHRRHRRLPLAVRRESGRSPDVLSSTKRLRQCAEAGRTEAPASAGRTTRIGPCAGAQLPGRV